MKRRAWLVTGLVIAAVVAWVLWVANKGIP